MISVDLPAPLSPTSPTSSPGWIFEIDAVESVDAGIPLVETLDGDDRRRHAQTSTLIRRAVRRSHELPTTAKHGQRADREFEPIGVDARKHEAVVDDADQQRADDRAEDGADASGERHAADHRTRYGLQFQALAQVGKRRLQAKNLDGSRKAGEDRADHEAGELDPSDGYAHRSRGFEKAARRLDPVAEIGQRHHRRGEQGRGTTNQTKEARNRPPPMKPVNSAIGILSTASKGGNPPEITTVSERTMNSMPSVVMKLGMSNLSVMKALTKPMTAQIRNPDQKRRPERELRR